MKQLTAEMGAFVRVNPFAPNHVEIEFENGEFFQSYKTIVAARLNGKYGFTEHHNSSRTTGKYLTQWCGISTARRVSGLEKGDYFEITQ